MIHALPGMGADHRMFPEPWNELPDFTPHDWPEYRGENSITEFAGRVADQCGIQDGDILIGTSLGGIIACEISKYRNLRTLILVGGARNKDEIRRSIAVLHPLAEIAPIEWLSMSAGSIPGELTQMFARVDPRFIRKMCAAVFEWEGLANTPVNCLRIHGTRDPIIAPPNDADLLLDAGHLIAMTHAAECVEWISRRIDAHRGPFEDIPPASED